MDKNSHWKALSGWIAASKGRCSWRGRGKGEPAGDVLEVDFRHRDPLLFSQLREPEIVLGTVLARRGLDRPRTLKEHRADGSPRNGVAPMAWTTSVRAGNFVSLPRESRAEAAPSSQNRPSREAADRGHHRSGDSSRKFVRGIPTLGSFVV